MFQCWTLLPFLRFCAFRPIKKCVAYLKNTQRKSNGINLKFQPIFPALWTTRSLVDFTQSWVRAKLNITVQYILSLFSFRHFQVEFAFLHEYRCIAKWSNNTEYLRPRSLNELAFGCEEFALNLSRVLIQHTAQNNSVSTTDWI